MNERFSLSLSIAVWLRSVPSAEKKKKPKSEETLCIVQNEANIDY